uniref:Uncharacterized protein n=1 Tax=Chromera velia CCMP2878 TaxID=1169474 RepID=A0A0G4HU47_9ALVE|eukprot:Cvel_31690.t1-p1 / transcript=Cvel_31690.t1 / gene=Cvel_31690 / organism=Chromera_velia_CCMP2878 / gene_product=Inositol phosphoceramide mannosyltransferase 3, putative / transcript_product=Inositol phosphoceramide mannosyltransferase 3, putative / location=Cvel_scaffold4770:1790-6001(-) / protein_length=790 / sequence_SO=supercontig / SO=protein_coding / is_pseudo=false
MSSAPHLQVANIGKHDMWTWEECEVTNAHEWQKAVDDFGSTRPKVPKHIHQIWIGPKAPPCMWLDSWRVEFMGKFKDWEYTLWGDEDVKKLSMINQDIYDREAKYQCKADILRLELLYQYGGIYIDADMLALGKSLDSAIEVAENNGGFAMGYEPDTKDKPYSILGNSVIVAAPRHPLVLMLIEYIKTIYPHKRPYLAVEWVTGPLAYTRCIVHCFLRLQGKLPFGVVPQEWFYPAFHYVPNPDAIDFSRFPNSLMFQFGYTCSGLEGYVERSNKCRKPLECRHHRNVQWPFGKLRDIRPALETRASGPIPKTVHHFCFQRNWDQRPQRWLGAWRHVFPHSAGWSHRVWTADELRELGSAKGLFGANLYASPPARMSRVSLRLLALEVLYLEGGFFGPLAAAKNLPASEAGAVAEAVVAAGGDELVDLERVDSDRGRVFEGLGVIACAPGSSGCAREIEALYRGEPLPLRGPAITPDSAAAYENFPNWDRYLGAAEIWDLAGSADGEPAEGLLHYAYSCRVPLKVAPAVSESEPPTLPKELLDVDHRVVVFTSRVAGQYRQLLDSVPGFLASLDGEHCDWDLLLLSVEWNAGDEHQLEVYRVSSGVRPPKDRKEFIGFVVDGRRAPALLHDFVGQKGEHDQQSVFDFVYSRLYNEGRSIHVAVEKFPHSREDALLLEGMGRISRAFQRVAGHPIPSSHEAGRTERHGNLFKAFYDNGQLMFEVAACPSGPSGLGGAVQWRAWNQDGGMNSEMRLSLKAGGSGDGGDLIEHCRVYFSHQVVFQANGEVVGA